MQLSNFISEFWKKCQVIGIQKFYDSYAELSLRGQPLANTTAMDYCSQGSRYRSKQPVYFCSWRPRRAARGGR
jgi:hypothetical protein